MNWIFIFVLAFLFFSVNCSSEIDSESYDIQNEKMRNFQDSIPDRKTYFYSNRVCWGYLKSPKLSFDNTSSVGGSYAEGKWSCDGKWIGPRGSGSSSNRYYSLLVNPLVRMLGKLLTYFIIPISGIIISYIAYIARFLLIFPINMKSFWNQITMCEIQYTYLCISLVLLMLLFLLYIAKSHTRFLNAFCTIYYTKLVLSNRLNMHRYPPSPT
jgi:hypothetical protein